MKSQLVMNALVMALGNRSRLGHLMHHSDRGSQYASYDFQGLLANHDIECSMSRKGECYDNAVVESFFGTLKSELVHRDSYRTRAEAKKAIHDYIEIYYNRKRRHSTLGYSSPVQFERDHVAA